MTNRKEKTSPIIETTDERSRYNAYLIIKGCDLQEEIQRRYGRNFTRVATEDLWKVIDETTVEVDEEEYPKQEYRTHTAPVETIYDLIKLGAESHMLSPKDVEDIAELVTELYQRMYIMKAKDN